MGYGRSTLPRKPIRLYSIHTVCFNKKEAQLPPRSKERGLHCEDLMNCQPYSNSRCHKVVGILCMP